MNWRIALIPILLVLAAALGAGCTGTPGPAPTPTPTTGVTMTTQPGTVPPTTLSESCIVPSPTVTVPPVLMVGVDVIRNPVTLNKQITVIFQGGKGQLLTQRVDVTVTHEDCTSETKSITRPESGSIIAGSSVTFNGSDQDRVEVTVTINGVPYRIIDKVFSQQTRP
jgi:hypothetical protein